MRMTHRSVSMTFAPTRWTIVLAAGRNDTARADAALAELCRTYWYPMYAYARRRGQTPHDAEDLTQAFFARLIEKDWLAPVRREKGRFRSFMLVAMKRFMADEWDKARAAKRGGGGADVPLDTQMAERLYVAQPAGAAPEQAFDREWAMTLLDHTLASLREEFPGPAKQAEYAVLKEYLTADRGGIPYEELAQRLRTTPGAARVAVHRLRKRFREIFRDEIAQTVAREDDREDELRHLLSALAR
jgi:RNA polymerase sigma factor (sigma-70 family)